MIRDATEGRVIIGPIRRRWRSLGLRGRVVLIVLSTIFVGWATFRVVEWWTEWPAVAVLRAEGELYPITFSPDGSVLTTRVYPTEEVILWDVASGRRRATWGRPDKRGRFAGAFSPDGRTYASPWYIPRSGANFSVDLIDVATGEVRSTFDAPHGGFLGLGFSEGGSKVRLLAASRTAKALVDVNAATGKVVASRPFATNSTASFSGFTSMSNDGRYLALPEAVATGAAQGSSGVTIWDLERDAEGYALPGAPGGPAPFRVAFSPDDKTLAVAREDGSIEFWDLATRRLRQATSAHERGYASVRLHFAPDGRTLASTGNLHLIRPMSLDFARAVLDHYLSAPDRAERMELVLLDARTGRRTRTSQRNGIAVFSPDGRTLATGHVDGTIRLHEVPKAP